MKYRDFRQLKNLLEKLLHLCDILRNKRVIIEIDHTPDYDISSFEGSTVKDYFFKNGWNFPDYIGLITDFSFDFKKIYHHDQLEDMSDESGIDFHNGYKLEFLNKIYDSHYEIFSENGFEINELDEFKLKVLRLDTVSNEDRKVYYEGTCSGESLYMRPDGWAVYANVIIEYIPHPVTLYQALIGESYALYKHYNKLNMAYFILFSAFECFIDTELYEYGSSDSRDRLQNRIKKLFEKQCSNISKHEVFNSLMPNFQDLKAKRNDIAHGKTVADVSDDFLIDAYYFVLALILSYQKRAKTFDELKTYI